MSMPPFHLAFPVDDLDAAREFYQDLLGCRIGRSAPRWIDFEFSGHQISAHLREAPRDTTPTNPVDGDEVPVRHFGLVLPWSQWEELVTRLREKEIGFLIEPRIRFVGTAGEQATFFLQDPAGNALEFKSFKDPARLFARDPD